MTPLISIIIPVYNTSDYLRSCINSILSQSFTDYECILIDDGSNDGSGLICDAFSAGDPRFRVLHIENGGVSSARNLGLEIACGDWICFVDSDDELLHDGLQTMVNCIRNDVDIVLAGYERYDEKGSIVYSVSDRVVVTLDKKQSLSMLYETHELYYSYLGYVWGRLFRRKIIQEHHLCFDLELRIKEDTLFITQYVLCSSGMTIFTTIPVYRYNERESSAMGVLKGGFDYRLLDGFRALVKMKNNIASVYPPYSEMVFIANEGIWIRYFQILHRMEVSKVQDERFLNTMKETMDGELNLFFYVRKKIRKLKRKWSCF